MGRTKSGDDRIRRSPAVVRAALVEAAEDLLSKRPIDALTIDEIVQQAGVGKGSFYSHFESKEALAQFIANGVRAEMESRVEAANAAVSDPASRVIRAFVVVAAFAIERPQRAHLLHRLQVHSPSMSSPLNAGVVRDITEGLMHGRFVVPSVEAGFLAVHAFNSAIFIRLLETPRAEEGLGLAQQLGALQMRALGLTLSEAEQLSAQAVHQLLQSRRAGDLGRDATPDGEAPANRGAAAAP